jgi:hypothetical protein
MPKKTPSPPGWAESPRPWYEFGIRKFMVSKKEWDAERVRFYRKTGIWPAVEQKNKVDSETGVQRRIVTTLPMTIPLVEGLQRLKFKYFGNKMASEATCFFTEWEILLDMEEIHHPIPGSLYNKKKFTARGERIIDTVRNLTKNFTDPPVVYHIFQENSFEDRTDRLCQVLEHALHLPSIQEDTPDRDYGDVFSLKERLKRIHATLGAYAQDPHMVEIIDTEFAALGNLLGFSPVKPLSYVEATHQKIVFCQRATSVLNKLAKALGETPDFGMLTNFPQKNSFLGLANLACVYLENSLNLPEIADPTEMADIKTRLQNIQTAVVQQQQHNGNWKAPVTYRSTWKQTPQIALKSSSESSDIQYRVILGA